MAATGSYSLLRKHDMTAAQHTRMLEDTGGYMDGWMDGWAFERQLKGLICIHTAPEWKETSRGAKSLEILAFKNYF